MEGGGGAKLKTLWHTERTEQGEGGRGDWESFRHGELFLQMDS